MSINVTDQESRRIQRYALALPARIEVKVDQTVSWNEVTRLEDISAFGAGFKLSRPIKRGRLVVVSLPMPRQLRCYDYLEPQYRIWAIVRRCIQLKTEPESFAIGVAFAGKNPPKGYLSDPAMLFDITDREEAGLWNLEPADVNADEAELPPQLRKHTRFSIPESLILELLDENGDVAASEVSVSENLSLGGASIFTSFNVDVGGFLRVRSERHNVSIIAIIRGRHVGPDSIVRLHVEFVDRFFPLEGIE